MRYRLVNENSSIDIFHLRTVQDPIMLIRKSHTGTTAVGSGMSLLMVVTFHNCPSAKAHKCMLRCSALSFIFQIRSFFIEISFVFPKLRQISVHNDHAHKEPFVYFIFWAKWVKFLDFLWPLLWSSIHSHWFCVYLFYDECNRVKYAFRSLQTPKAHVYKDFLSEIGLKVIKCNVSNSAPREDAY